MNLISFFSPKFLIDLDLWRIFEKQEGVPESCSVEEKKEQQMGSIEEGSSGDGALYLVKLPQRLGTTWSSAALERRHGFFSTAFRRA